MGVGVVGRGMRSPYVIGRYVLYGLAGAVALGLGLLGYGVLAP